MSIRLVGIKGDLKLLNVVSGTNQVLKRVFSSNQTIRPNKNNKIDLACVQAS